MFQNLKKKLFSNVDLEIPLLFFQKNILALYTTAQIFYDFLCGGT